MWPHAAVLVQQLVSIGTTLPIVVFNCTELPAPAVQLISALGARVRSLTPAMPVPSEFSSERLALPFQKRDGTRAQGLPGAGPGGLGGPSGPECKSLKVRPEGVLAHRLDLAAWPGRTGKSGQNFK